MSNRALIEELQGWVRGIDDGPNFATLGPISELLERAAAMLKAQEIPEPVNWKAFADWLNNPAVTVEEAKDTALSYKRAYEHEKYLRQGDPLAPLPDPPEAT